MNLMATAPLATLAMGLTDTKLAPLPGPLQSSQLVQPAAPAPAAAPVAPSSGLWETVRIEVPSGFALEALKASKDQKSNAEPDLPLAPSSTLSNNSAPSNAIANTAKAETATPQALTEQRAAQYQAMADQMGEAMARRLMAQIERGQWKMQMRMQPAALGRIDVELNMHASGLDAKFSSDNAVTRELMAQGSARLRDTLSQTGTTVASVTVNGDSGRQSGGNSTPGQKSKGTPSANSKKNAADPVVAAVATPSATQSDGLNVLA
jgi:flagellar hook-length control protein FliK